MKQLLHKLLLLVLRECFVGRDQSCRIRAHNSNLTPIADLVSRNFTRAFLKPRVRDSIKQERVKIADLVPLISQKLRG